LYCGACEYLGEKCSGCGNIEGKPFWTAEFGVEACPLYACCVIQRKLEHCGLCDDLPCKLFLEFHDPALSPEEAEASVRERQKQLLERREMGTEEWVERLGQKR
jgi:Protein of unknown function (DUF3795)